MKLDTHLGERVLTSIEQDKALWKLDINSSLLARTLSSLRAAGVVERRGRKYVLTATGKAAAQHLRLFNRALTAPAL